MGATQPMPDSVYCAACVDARDWICAGDTTAGNNEDRPIMSVPTFQVVKFVSLYSVSPSPDSDISTQRQLVSMCKHSLFLCMSKPLCTISLIMSDLELCFANKGAMSLPADGEMEYLGSEAIDIPGFVTLE